MMVNARSTHQQRIVDSISDEKPNSNFRKSSMDFGAGENSNINTAKIQNSTNGLMNTSNQSARQDGRKVSQQDKIVFMDDQKPINEQMLRPSEQTIELGDRTSLDAPQICGPNQKRVQGKCRVLYTL